MDHSDLADWQIYVKEAANRELAVDKVQLQLRGGRAEMKINMYDPRTGMLMDYPDMLEIRRCPSDMDAEQLVRKIRTAGSLTETRRKVLEEHTLPAGEYIKQCLDLGQKKLEMQENMQSLTASQKDDSLSEGLKQGGHSRH